ncbi:MAG: helix-turn-helix domain-containing protein [Pseudomonadota bacterium]
MSHNAHELAMNEIDRARLALEQFAARCDPLPADAARALEAVNKANDSLKACTFITSDALARRWGVCSDTLATRRREGTGPASLKVGKRYLYRLADVLAWEQERLR